MIHVARGLPLEFDPKADELQCEFTVHVDSECQMSVFDLPPPVFPQRIVTMTFEPVSANHVHVVFGGNTRPFQNGFVTMKIKGQAYKVDPSDQYSENFRVICDVDTSKTQECIDYMTEILGEKCLQSSPIIVRQKQNAHVNLKLPDVLKALAMRAHVRLDI